MSDNDVSLTKVLMTEDDYEEGEEIGKGGFGVVYRGILIKTGEVVAIKHLSRTEAFDTAVIAQSDKMFLREVTIPLRLPYPTIVPLIGIVMKPKKTPNDKAIIITPFMEYGSLDKYIKDFHNGRANAMYTPTRMSIIMYGVAATMAKLHKHNIMHRDLKDQNILLDERFEPRLADFGLSKNVNINNLLMTQHLGTPYYMAPELLENSNDYSFPTDVYAYGIFVYKFFVPNFKLDNNLVIKTERQLFNAICNRVRYKKPTIQLLTESIWKLINDCWDQNSTKRPTFEQITQRLSDPGFELVLGTDREEYLEYVNRINEQLIDKAPKQPEPSPRPKRFDFKTGKYVE